jgi:hypothetical protein
MQRFMMLTMNMVKRKLQFQCQIYKKTLKDNLKFDIFNRPKNSTLLMNNILNLINLNLDQNLKVYK